MKAKSKSIIFTIFVIVFIGAVVLFLGKGDESKTPNTENITTQIMEQEKIGNKLDSIQIEFNELETAYEVLKTQIVSKDDSIYLLSKQIEMLERKNKAFLSYQEYLRKGLDSLQFELTQLKLINMELKKDLSVYTNLNSKPCVSVGTKYSDKIKLEPSGSYFYSYIKITSPSIFITKAIFKNKDGEIVKEILNPKIINTNNLSVGLYYLSLYDENEKLLKCKVVYKKE